MTPAPHNLDIYDIHKLLGLRKGEYIPKSGSFHYDGTFATGDFDQLHDYDAGLLHVSIRPSLANYGEKLFTIMFSITTIDDGGWQAFDPRQTYTLEQANERVELVAQKFIEFMGGSTKLPTEKVLNEFLGPLGLWGQYTG